MIVCSCRVVDDRHVREEARCGSYKQMLKRTGAGSECGKCLKGVKRVFDAEVAALQCEAGQGGGETTMPKSRS